MESKEKALKIADILSSKKAKEIQVIGIGELTLIADYFVICTGTSTTQVKALANELEEKMSEAGEAPLGVEGFKTAGWILLDFGNVVVHVFTNEMREFYNLERLWSDGEKIEVDFED